MHNCFFYLSKIQIIAFKVYQIVIFILLSFIFVIFEPKVHIYCQYSPFFHSLNIVDIKSNLFIKKKKFIILAFSLIFLYTIFLLKRKMLVRPLSLSLLFLNSTYRIVMCGDRR